MKIFVNDGNKRKHLPMMGTNDKRLPPKETLHRQNWQRQIWRRQATRQARACVIWLLSLTCGLSSVHKQSKNIDFYRIGAHYLRLSSSFATVGQREIMTEPTRTALNWVNPFAICISVWRLKTTNRISPVLSAFMHICTYVSIGIFATLCVVCWLVGWSVG